MRHEDLERFAAWQERNVLRNINPNVAEYTLRLMGQLNMTGHAALEARLHLYDGDRVALATDVARQRARLHNAANRLGVVIETYIVDGWVCADVTDWKESR